MSFQVVLPTSPEVPIVVSVPHAGTMFPDELVSDFIPALRQAPDDTDWYVHQLYDFAPALGITMLVATHSRWVIDLNRNPHQKPLYTDGRIITELCPTTTFLGQSLYIDGRKNVAQEEVKRRTDLYFNPYHHQLSTLLKAKKKKFGQVLLWDSHSIRQHVPTIHHQPFPDFILGDADGTSSDTSLSKLVLERLTTSGRTTKYNTPFKGGYITRHYGRPEEQQHALQLEMTKIKYMNDDEHTYNTKRAAEIRNILSDVFKKLIQQLT